MACAIEVAVVVLVAGIVSSLVMEYETRHLSGDIVTFTLKLEQH